VFNITGSEVVILLLLALVVLGPEKLPDAIRRFGRVYAEVRKMSQGFQSELRQALDEPVRELRSTADMARRIIEDPGESISRVPSSPVAGGTRPTASTTPSTPATPTTPTTPGAAPAPLEPLPVEAELAAAAAERHESGDGASHDLGGKSLDEAVHETVDETVDETVHESVHETVDTTGADLGDEPVMDHDVNADGNGETASA